MPETLLDHLDQFCAHCLIGDCLSCDGAPCQCGHEGLEQLEASHA